ncbi:uncharacterized protein LOC117511339 [Thalassophryne amazonica]|uniref:uncharacterized protein LOC117511339 n=1 Tax=Thalassophryne amazonica TaxID=390379 RepID=UPI00147238BC|nr:uncharacterized protein LOC117511339 [Thalassophryne amazonica]
MALPKLMCITGSIQVVLLLLIYWGWYSWISQRYSCKRIPLRGKLAENWTIDTVNRTEQVIHEYDPTVNNYDYDPAIDDYNRNRVRRSFCRGGCTGTAGARQFTNPCSPTTTDTVITRDLYVCYNATQFVSKIVIPFSIIRVGGQATPEMSSGTHWKWHEWYLSSVDWDQDWGTIFTYTGSDWTPYPTTQHAKEWKRRLTLTRHDNHLLLSFNTTDQPLLEKPPRIHSYTEASCYHLTLFVYRPGVYTDPHTDFSICTNITKRTDSSPTTPTAVGLSLGPQTSVTKIQIINGKIETDDWFLVTTGISGQRNNWLLMAEQAAKPAKKDCVVCLGPRPILRVVPAPLTSDCLLEIMVNTFIPLNHRCISWDTIYPVANMAKNKPLFSEDVAEGNFTCVKLPGTGQKLGELNETVWCSHTLTPPSPFKPIARTGKDNAQMYPLLGDNPDTDDKEGCCHDDFDDSVHLPDLFPDPGDYGEPDDDNDLQASRVTHGPRSSAMRMDQVREQGYKPTLFQDHDKHLMGEEIGKLTKMSTYAWYEPFKVASIWAKRNLGRRLKDETLEQVEAVLVGKLTDQSTFLIEPASRETVPPNTDNTKATEKDKTGFMYTGQEKDKTGFMHTGPTGGTYHDSHSFL